MTLDREALAALADVLVPAAGAMPAASEVDVGDAGLDRVLAARPDLEPELERVLADGRGDDPAEQVKRLQREDAPGFDALALAVTGAYYTDARVRELIGYPGQRYEPERVGQDIEASDPMLRRVVERGPVYRPTPAA